MNRVSRMLNRVTFMPALIAILYTADLRAQGLNEIPKELLGLWQVKSAEGAKPAFWGLNSISDFVGLRIELRPEKAILFGQFSGRPYLLKRYQSTYNALISIPPAEKMPDFEESGRQVVVNEIGLGDCQLNNEPQPSCPVFIFTTSLQDGSVNFFLLPWAVARLELISMP